MRASAGWQVPLEEVSALCLSDDGASVVAVGDDRWCFGRAEIGPDGIVQTVDLRVTDDVPELAAEWNDPQKANARGEGILPLRHGHILVAKQRESTWLIELGPTDEAARGFTSESAIRAGERFTLPATTTEMHALAAWRVDDPEIESLNDLAVDEHGALHVVSSKSRRLARLDHDLDPRGGTARLAEYDLPADLFESKQDKAEGLVHSRRVGWLVGLDLDRDGDNVVLLTGVP